MDVKNSDMIDLSLDQIIKLNRMTKKAEAYKSRQNVYKKKNALTNQSNSVLLRNQNAGTFQTKQNVFRNKKLQNAKWTQKYITRNPNQNFASRKVQQFNQMKNRSPFNRKLNVQGRFQFQQRHQNPQGGFHFQQHRQFSQGGFNVQQRRQNLQGGFQIQQQRRQNSQGKFQIQQQRRQNSQGRFQIQQQHRQNSQGGFQVQHRFKIFKNQKHFNVAMKTNRPRINRNFKRFDNQVPQLVNNFQNNRNPSNIRLMNDILTVSIPNNLAESNYGAVEEYGFQNMPQAVEDDLDNLYVSPRYFQIKQAQAPALSLPQNLTRTTLNERFGKNFAATVIY